MKSIYEFSEEQWMKGYSNNWLKLHGYAMFRRCGKRRRFTKQQKKEFKIFPFK